MIRTLDKFKNHHINKAAGVPTAPHFAVLVFATFSYTAAGYDRGDPSTSESIQTLNYFAFDKQGEWEDMIRCFTQEQIDHPVAFGPKPQIVFFHSGGAGHLSMSINIGVNPSR